MCGPHQNSHSLYRHHSHHRLLATLPLTPASPAGQAVISHPQVPLQASNVDPNLICNPNLITNNQEIHSYQHIFGSTYFMYIFTF